MIGVMFRHAFLLAASVALAAAPKAAAVTDVADVIDVAAADGARS